MPGPATARARTLQRRLAAAATERLHVKLAALFFSLVLWFVVSAEEPTQEWVDARLVLSLDSTVSLQGSIPHVQALVVGRGRELLKLYAAPPLIRRVVRANTPADVSLELGTDDVILPSNVDARVRDVRPRTVPLRFAVAATRRVPVRLLVQATAAPGVRITGVPRAEPGTVTVSGPRDRVRALDGVATPRTALVVSGPGVERPIALDTAGLGVLVRPTEVRVHVPAVRDTARPSQSDSALGVLSDSLVDSGRGTARHDSARRDTARHDSTRHDSTRHDGTRRDTLRRPPSRPSTTP